MLCFSLLYLYVNAFRSTIIDDAFIQFQYADTLAKYGTWGFYPDHSTNTATSALNVLLLSVFTLITGSTVTGAILFTALLLLLLLIILQNLSNKLFGTPFFGLFLFFAIIANPLLLSCLGMEVMLFAVLWIASLSLLVYNRCRWLAACLALLTLARPDGFLLFVIVGLLGAFSSLQAKEKLVFISIYILSLLPWHLFAWFQLGSVVPDTLLIKMGQQAWLGNVSFGSGLGSLYFSRFPLEMLFSFLLLPLIFLGVRSTNRDARIFALIAITYGAVHYAAYSTLKVPPYHWYYTHLVLSVVAAGSVGAAAIARRIKGLRYLLLFLPISGLLYVAAKSGIPVNEAPVHTNWGTHEQYRKAGEWIKQNTNPDETILMGGEIGTLAYYSDRILLNNFSNQWALQRLLNRNINEKSEWKKNVFRLNFLWRKEAKRYPRASYRMDHVPYPHRPATDPSIIYFHPTSTKWIPEGVLYVRKTRQQ